LDGAARATPATTARQPAAAAHRSWSTRHRRRPPWSRGTRRESTLAQRVTAPALSLCVHTHLTREPGQSTRRGPVTSRRHVRQVRARGAVGGRRLAAARPRWPAAPRSGRRAPAARARSIPCAFWTAAGGGNSGSAPRSPARRRRPPRRPRSRARPRRHPQSPPAPPANPRNPRAPAPPPPPPPPRPRARRWTSTKPSRPS